MIEFTVRCFTTALKTPFVSNKGRVDRISHVFVAISYDDAIGMGVCRLDSDVDPHVLEIVKTTVATHGLENPNDFATRLEELTTRSELTVACDIALFDLHGKRAGLPAWHFFGGEHRTLTTAVTIGAGPLSQMLQAVTHYRDWPVLKIKLRSGEPISFLRQVREAYAGEIWVDANGAWDLESAQAAMAVLETAGVAVVEQPFPKGRADWLGQLNCGPIAIAVDEDIDGPESVARVSGLVDLVNVKLKACGGIAGAHSTIKAAQEVGLRTMIGCRSESVAGVTAAATLAHLTELADLDGYFDIEADPFEGVNVVNGVILRPNCPGIGMVLNTTRMMEAKYETNEVRST